MLSRRHRLALLAWLSLVLGTGCFGGPISDFPGKAEGDGTDTNGPGSDRSDAGTAPEHPRDGDGDDAAGGDGDGDSGDGDSEVPGTIDGGTLDLDGGVPSDASVDTCDAAACNSALTDAGASEDAGA